MAMPQNFLKRSHSSASNGSGLHRVSYLISVRIYQIEKIPVWRLFTGLVGGGGFMTLGGVGAVVYDGERDMEYFHSLSPKGVVQKKRS